MARSVSEIQEWARGTSVTRYRDGLFVGFIRARALCPDGKIHTIALNNTARDHNSILGRLTFQDKTVSGYITWKNPDTGLTVGDGQAVIFVPTGKYANIFLAAQVGMPWDTPKEVLLDRAKEKGLIDDR